MSNALEGLVGMRLRRVQYDAECGQWNYFFEDRVLQMSCPWRIVRDGRITSSFEADGEVFSDCAPDGTPQSSTLVVTACVESVVLSPETSDLTIRFDNGSRLDVFHDSHQYEAWQLRGPEGSCTVASPGGGLSVWKP